MLKIQGDFVVTGEEAGIDVMLTDVDGNQLPVVVQVRPSGIQIETPTINTPGEANGYGMPIFIEFQDGKLKLHVFSMEKKDGEPVVEHEWTPARERNPEPNKGGNPCGYLEPF